MKARKTEAAEPETVTLEVAGKSPWKSKGVIGAVIAIAAMLGGFWHIKIDADNLTEIVLSALGIIGAIIALWGRIKATHPIVFTGTKPGGAFNPHAEIRRAEPWNGPRSNVQGPRSGNPAKRRGSVLMRLLLALALFALLVFVALFNSSCAWKPAPATEREAAWVAKFIPLENDFDALCVEWERELDQLKAMPDEPDAAKVAAYEAWEKKWGPPFDNWIKRNTALYDAFPEITPERARELLRPVPPEDPRPFYVRLLDSISFGGQARAKRDAETGALSVEVTRVEAQGGAEF